MVSRYSFLKRIEKRELLTDFLPAASQEEETESLQAIERRELYWHFAGQSDALEQEKAIFYLALRLNLSLQKNFSSILIKWFSWFTTVRLFLLRDCREHNVPQHFYAVSWGGYADILQFSYAIELIPCLYQLWDNPSLLYNSEWQNTVFNAASWFVFNLISYGTGHVWVNLITFALDILREHYFINKQIKELESLKKSIVENGADDAALANINKKIVELHYKHLREVLVAVGIFVGMAMFYLNCLAAVPASVPLIGATLVILFGVVLGNLGNRLCQWDQFVANWKHSSFVQALKDEFPILKGSFEKLLREFIRPLSPSLYDSLANCKDDPTTAAAAVISTLLLSAGLYGLSIACAGLLVVASHHLLITFCILLAVTETAVRCTSYLVAPAIHGAALAAISKKLVIPPSADPKKPQAETHFELFSQLTPKEFELVAKAAGISVKELVRLIAIWDEKLNPSSGNTPAANPSAQTKGLEEYSLFKKKIDAAADKHKVLQQPSLQQLVPP